MKVKLGIDPGLSGAIVAMFEDDTAIVQHIDMPLMAKTYGTGNQVDPMGIYEFIDTCTFHIAAAYIERVSARPGQGVSGMFSFGHSVGIVEGVIGSSGIPIRWVLPTKWKRAAGLLKAEKDAARTLALQMYPELREELKAKKRGQALADAIMIARFGA